MKKLAMLLTLAVFALTAFSSPQGAELKCRRVREGNKYVVVCAPRCKNVPYEVWSGPCWSRGRLLYW